jgi:GT2 family glycosyltransferase
MLRVETQDVLRSFKRNLVVTNIVNTIDLEVQLDVEVAFERGAHLVGDFTQRGIAGSNVEHAGQTLIGLNGACVCDDRVLRATGDIIFLADHDDIWAPDRVAKTLDAFAQNPSATIVAANIALIDENGNSIERDERLKLRPFDSRFIPNIISNRFQGSAMAFRSDLLPEVLPFPKKVHFVHDAWIGARCALLGRTSVYISEPMLYYRRHGSNDSGSLTLFGKMRKRVELLATLAIFPLRRKFSMPVDE